jgi:hypothetical protein
MATTLAHAGSANPIPAQSLPLLASYWRFIGAIGRTTPHSIPYWADGADVEERAAHIEAVTSAFRDYLADLLADTAAALPSGSLDPSDTTDILSDAFSDLNGAMSRIAHETWMEAA